jgi:uncharacterized UBP type Zn finger protein
MRYKKLLVVVLSIFLSGNLFSQVEEVTFKVTNYEINGVNYDDLAIKENIALTFYRCDEETVCFANYFRNSSTLSYGGVYGLKKQSFDETPKRHAYDEFQFTWDYANSYDKDKGKAKVTLLKIYIGNSVKMIAEILVLSTNEVLKFEGYLEE